MPGLSFVTPAFLLGALAVTVPLLLHLLRRRPRVRILFSAVRLLTAVPAAQTRRQHVRDLALLALRVSALVLLAVAFAGPRIATSGAERVPVTVVALDTSFSMSAPGQFERARRLAVEALERAPAGHQVAVMTFADDASVAAPPARSRAGARAAIAGARPGFGATRYGSAIERARQLVAAGGRIVLVTDLQRNGWQGTAPHSRLPDGAELVIEEVSGPAANLAVVEIERTAGRIAALVRNTGASPATSDAALLLDGRRVETARVEAAPGATARVEFRHAVPPRGAVAVRVDDASGYAADNTRYHVLDPPDPPRVVIVTGVDGGSGEAFYVRRALGVESGSHFRTDVLTARELRAMDPAARSSISVVALLSTVGLDREGRDLLAGHVRAGGGLLVAAGGEVNPDALDGLLGRAIGSAEIRGPDAALHLAAGDGRHPVFRPMTSAGLAGARFEQVARLDAPSAVTVLARFDNGRPALVEGRVGEGRVMLFGSDLSNRGNNLPLHPGFVPFLHEVVRYLGAHREASRDFVVGSAPRGLGPGPGVYPLSSAADAERDRAPARRDALVALNVDPRESDPHRMPREEFEATASRLARQPAGAAPALEAGDDSQPWWRAALLAVMVCVLAEGVLGRRRRLA